MCFFIAGVQPKTRTLSDSPGRCPRCGLHQADTRQVDHYISLFFIPLIRVKKGTPFLYCHRCRQPVGGGDGQPVPPPTGSGNRVCGQCGGSLEGHFKYCPHCGQRQ